ncbi:MAG TPA: extracellular solute-binding protein [Aggregatilineales bacterium]|nr:extracellular solute-binding protein [Anaerolineae bacterium]HUN05322.1 extracellular solute-binding protein [Aggregatilineales bacterium]
MTFLTKQTRVAILLMVIIGLLSMVLPAGAQGATIRYANWNLGTEEENNLQRQLVAAYVEANPGVTIEFVDMSGDGGWEEKLTNFAARGELPDVFMANNTPYYVQNGWAADLTAQVEADADWATIPQVLRNAVTYDGKVLGLPSAQFIMGYFINQDLFEAANLDAPQYGVSAEDFFAAASQLTDVQQGVLGLHEMGPILGWYPSTQDSNLGWFSFDGTHMNYNSDAFRSAVNTAIEMRPNTWQGLTDEQKTAFTAQGPWELFVNQESGAVWEGGWALPSYVQNATFNWDFIGIPGGNQAMVADLLVVSATAADQDAAYDFARWMSFSSAGYAKEAELATAAGLVPTRMPVSVTPESIDLYMSFAGDRPGLRQALENLDNSLVESLAKIVPGYINARWEGRPGINIGDQSDVNLGFIFDNFAAGSFKFEDLSAQLQDFANGILDDARAQLAS